MSAEDWKTVRRGLDHLRGRVMDAADIDRLTSALAALERLEAEHLDLRAGIHYEEMVRKLSAAEAGAAAMRDVLGELRKGFALLVEKGEWHPDAVIGPVRSINAALAADAGAARVARWAEEKRLYEAALAEGDGHRQRAEERAEKAEAERDAQAFRATGLEVDKANMADEIEALRAELAGAEFRATQRSAELQAARVSAAAKDETLATLRAEVEDRTFRLKQCGDRLEACGNEKAALHAEVERLKGLVPGRPDLLPEAVRLRLAMEQAQCELRTPSAARKTLSDAIRGGDPAGLATLLAQARREERERCEMAVAAMPDYDEHRNGFEGLVDRSAVAAAIRALGEGT